MCHRRHTSDGKACTVPHELAGGLLNGTDDLRQPSFVNPVCARGEYQDRLIAGHGAKMRDLTIWETSHFRAAAASLADLVLSGISTTSVTTPRRRSSSATRPALVLSPSMQTFYLTI